MAFRLTGHPKTHRITETLARKFSDMDPAPDDRPLSENRLAVYRRIIAEGNFRPCQWAAAYCKETGGTYRVNGKHTSTLMATLDPLPELYAVVEYYECDTLHDISRLYSTYDSKIMSRNAADIYHSFAACVPALKDVSRQTIERVPSAICYATVKEGLKNTQPQDRAEALIEYPDFAIWVDKIVGRSGAINGHLRRVPVMAAMFLTYRKAPRIALDFWTAVRDETGPTPDCPDRKLARWLILNSNNVTTRQATKLARFRIHDREYFVKCIHAWNAYRAGETTRLNYHAKAELPDVK